ncbi:hypothetical protein [Nocardioides sp. Soil777]|nr:hypothetical protein [Nocardioides sp. Soil777]
MNDRADFATSITAAARTMHQARSLPETLQTSSTKLPNIAREIVDRRATP